LYDDDLADIVDQPVDAILGCSNVRHAALTSACTFS
jgi:hypothetical protein